jgi:hypothetical protein
MREPCDEELLEAALRACGVVERELAMTQLLTDMNLAILNRSRRRPQPHGRRGRRA